MTTLELAPAVSTSGWTLRGHAAIDERPPAYCSLTIRGDGTWRAELSTFTLAGNVDLFFIADDGGHFCGPAFVVRSRADSEPLRAITELAGDGPLLVVVPGTAELELPDAGTLDGEVVE